jgi:hypothetical protein
MGRMVAGRECCDPRGRSALIAAYREGLGLAAVSVTRAPGGVRISAVGQGSGDGVPAADAANANWWCRRAADAERVAAAAMRRLQRRESRNGAGPAALESVSSAETDCASGARLLADEAIASAAKRLNITLLSDAEVAAEAMAAIARVDEEIERLQRSGELRSVNKSYRAYRIEASARGEKTLRYDEWMGKYRENLVRQLAAALRYV